MTNLLQEELARRGSLIFDEADVLDAVRRTVASRRVRRQRMTVGAAGFIVVALAVGAVTFTHRSPQVASPPGPGIVVSAAPAMAVDPGVLESSVTAMKERLADVVGVSVDATGAGGIVASGPTSARDRIVAAISAEGQFSVRPVLATNADIAPPATLSTLTAQPTGSVPDQQIWQKSVIAAAKKNALPCQRTQVIAVSTRALVSCNQQDGSVAVLAPSIVSGPVRAEVITDPAGQTALVLSVNFGAAGRSDFDNYTASHVGSRVAFTIDNQTISAPTITSPITTGTVTIQGNFSQAQLNQYAQELTHPLPAPFNVTDISSTH